MKGNYNNKNNKKFVKPKNKLNLNQFHQISKKKNKGPTPYQKTKKKIHDLTRLISHSTLPEDIIQLKQTQLEETQKKFLLLQKEKKKIDKQKDYFGHKYQQIKNLEMKKLARKLRQIEKEAIQSGHSKELDERKQEIMVQIEYVKKFPLNEKYISLFKENNEIGTQKKMNLLQSIRDRFARIQEKKYNFDQTDSKKIRNSKEDDFFAQEEITQNRQKKLVDKQGKLIRT